MCIRDRSSLEIDRARQQADVDRVLPYAIYEAKARESGYDKPTATDVLKTLLEDLGLQSLLVPSDFPLGTADALRASGVHLEVAPNPLFPERQIKSEWEVEAIRTAQQGAEAGMAAAVDMLRIAQIENGTLVHDGQPVTSERLRRAIHSALMSVTARDSIPSSPAENKAATHTKRATDRYVRVNPS